MDKNEVKEIIDSLKSINLKIEELKTLNDYLTNELKNSANIDNEGIENSNLKSIKTKISNIKIDIKNQIIPKIEENV